MRKKEKEIVKYPQYRRNVGPVFLGKSNSRESPHDRFLLSASLATGCCPLSVWLVSPSPGRYLLGLLRGAFLGVPVGSLPQGPPGGLAASALRELGMQSPEEPRPVRRRPSCFPIPVLCC